MFSVSIKLLLIYFKAPVSDVVEADVKIAPYPCVYSYVLLLYVLVSLSKRQEILADFLPSYYSIVTFISAVSPLYDIRTVPFSEKSYSTATSSSVRVVTSNPEAI